MDIETLRNEGWWATTTQGDKEFVVGFKEVQEYIVKLKLEFEERLANAVNDAYDEGYAEGYKDGISL